MLLGFTADADALFPWALHPDFLRDYEETLCLMGAVRGGWGRAAGESVTERLIETS